MIQMPGKSFSGVPPALSAQEKQLSARLKEHVETLAGKIGARSLTAAPANLERAAAYITQSMEKLGYKPQRHEYKISDKFGDDPFFSRAEAAKLVGMKAANIVAEIKGSDAAGEIVVIGAHYDSVFDCPAANDNGSGVASMLELARYLAGKKCRRTVRFVAFTNEEPPFFRTENMGSSRYARECHARKENIVAMLSLETMGYYTDKPDSQEYPAPMGSAYPTSGNFIAFVANLKSAELNKQCLATFRQSAQFPSEGICAPESLPGIDYSDQQGFWALGYPALMITDTAHLRYKHYHTPGDTADKVQYGNLARVVHGLEAVLNDLANKR
ncbi:MAG: M28 family peptidase [Cyanobacteria bacterium SZAS LIN-3]|nr:M28 family peptidase [Cyanobacteria bacterium SZAS LIN-3]